MRVSSNELFFYQQDSAIETYLAMSSASAVRLSPSVQKQKLKLELLRGSRLKLESLPASVVVHEHLVRAGCMFFGTATRRTLTRLHRHYWYKATASHSDISVQGFVTAQKEHVGPTLLSIYSYYLMDISCNTLVLQPLQLLQICPLLSME